MTALGPDAYSWNARNQLTAISGSSSASFQYDALGRRVGKTINGTTTSFLHDGWQIVRETEGATATGYLTGLALDEVYRRSTPTGSHDYLTDALGSILGLADSSQAITTSYTYEPYGGTTVQGAASTNPVQYTGRENDGTGLYYYRNRYYHPGLSRFVSEDPIGLDGGFNLFAYVEGSPINFRDPLGLQLDPMNTRVPQFPIQQLLSRIDRPLPTDAVGLGLYTACVNRVCAQRCSSQPPWYGDPGDACMIEFSRLPIEQQRAISAMRGFGAPDLGIGICMDFMRRTFPRLDSNPCTCSLFPR